MLVEHLFAKQDVDIPGFAYAVSFQLANGHTGGDIIDVYQFDNDSLAISVADISGKGTAAAIHAALIKYGLRAYASEGLAAQQVLRALDRLYLENNKFEHAESFASVFFAHVGENRRTMTYASAGHEPVFLVRPNGDVLDIAVTAPIIGVFDDQHHLFRQRSVNLEPGAILVATTDGVTEARNSQGELFGMERLRAIVASIHNCSETQIVDHVLGAVDAFCGERPRSDDIAIIAARFL